MSALALFFALVGAEAAPARPKTLVLLASGLSYDDLRRGGALPQVRRLAEMGGVALLHTGVAGQATEAAEFLTVGAGERLAAPPRLMPAPGEDGAAVTVADLAEEAYNLHPPGGGAGRAVYRRRFGRWPPAYPGAAVVHVGLPALRQAQPSPRRAAQVGALGDALRSAGRRAAAYGDWRAALVLVDGRGVVPGGSVTVNVRPEQLAEAMGRADVVAVAAGDARALDLLAGAALPLARSGEAHVLVAVPAPRRGAGGYGKPLGFVAAAGPGIAARSLLISPTTRTPALVTNMDLAPAILAWQGVTVPPGMAGRRATAVPHPDVWGAVATLDRQVKATARATVPVLVGYGALAIGTGLAALVALLSKRPAWAGGLRFGLLAAAAALIAFLPVGVWPPTSAWLYGAAVAATSVLLAALALLLGGRFGWPPLGMLFTGAAALVAADAVRGSPLVARALLSGYYVPGVRFYGVGNEYMGLAVGAALVGPLLVRDARGRAPGVGAGTALLWAALLLALGVPAWGADAGGVITAAVTFGAGVGALRAGRLRARHVAAAFAAAFALVAAFAVLDRLRPEAARSHVGAAVAAGQARGPGALVEIAARKAAMNLRLALTPGAAGALAGMAPIWWLLGRGPLRGRARSALLRRPHLRRALPAAAWGALAATLFNDSGVAPALLLLAPPTGALIDGMLCDSWEWITEHGASALPSRTS